MSDKEPVISQLHAVVEGRVQGVGFRFFVQENALNYDLVGWVRNRWDRTVELVAEGKRTDLESLLAELRRGPRASMVTKVKSTWKPATHKFTNFNIRPTR